MRPGAGLVAGTSWEASQVSLPVEAFDDRIAIVGTAGSGKTYAAKGFVERLLESGARVAIVDPLGVWWGLRASCDGSAPGYPVVVFGGRHADVPITADTAAVLGQVIAREAFVCVVDLSELGSSAARRRFMAAFAGEVPPAPSTPAARLALWCGRLPTPAPEMLRTLAAQGERYIDADELAAMLDKKPSGGHWNSGIAVLRNNRLIEIDGRRYRVAELFRE